MTTTSPLPPVGSPCGLNGCVRPRWVQPHYVQVQFNGEPSILMEPQITGYTIHAFCWECCQKLTWVAP